MFCRICNSEKITRIFSRVKDLEYGTGGEFDFCRCEECGTIFLCPTPTVAELLNFYPSDYHGYLSPTSKLTKFLISSNLKRRAALYKRLIGSGGDILDVGSADGAHFEALGRYGDWRFAGVEFNDEIAKKGRDNGYEIYTDTIESHDFAGRKFDIIIMNNLIEHVTDPARTVSRARDLLKDGGYIVGETPSTHSLDFRIFRSCWGGMHTPRHTFLFNPRSLTELFRRSDLQVKKINYPLDTSHWALSIQNSLQNGKFARTKIRQGRTFYYPLLLLALLPINLLQKIFRYTGTMQFVAQKIK